MVCKTASNTHTYAKVCSGKNNKVEINFHQNFRANDLTNEAVLKIDLDKFLGSDGTFDLLGQMETTGNATSFKMTIAASLAALLISI